MTRRSLYAMAVGAAAAALFIAVTPGRAQGEPAVSITGCSDVEVVLGGYSQGAAVSGYVTSETVPAGYALTALSADVAESVAAVVLFGKPSPEILRLLRHDAPPMAIGPAFLDKTLDLCAPKDPVCEPGEFDRSAHSAYVVNEIAGRAADFAAERLRSG